MEKQTIIISEQLEKVLSEAVARCKPDKIFVLTDETTHTLCQPLIAQVAAVQSAGNIVIGTTDTHKNLEALSHVWSELQRMGATRHSLLINLGGGMVTDLGGFAASTFKRGIHFINIPTTLLAMVDASVGGKTGINFGGLKNEIGVFQNADCVILDTLFLQTLDQENILSGYAEMLKHGLISTEAHWAKLLNFDIEQPDLKELALLVANSVQVKEGIVTEDPTEKGIRKALNLGHTIGHAFESLSLQRSLTQRPTSNTPLGQRTLATEGTQEHPILHGYAVAYGLVCELYLSTTKTNFPTDKMRQTVRFIFDHYGRMPITCDDYPTLLELMTHDKKNTGRDINFTLLGGIGDIRINQTATRQEIEEALDFYREG